MNSQLFKEVLFEFEKLSSFKLVECKLHFIFETLDSFFVESTNDSSLFRNLAKPNSPVFTTQTLLHYLINDIWYIGKVLEFKHELNEKDELFEEMQTHINSFQIEYNNLLKLFEKFMESNEKNQIDQRLLNCCELILKGNFLDLIKEKDIIVKPTIDYISNLSLIIKEMKPLRLFAIAFLPCSLIYGNLKEFYEKELALEIDNRDESNLVQGWIAQQCRPITVKWAVGFCVGISNCLIETSEEELKESLSKFAQLEIEMTSSSVQIIEKWMKQEK